MGFNQWFTVIAEKRCREWRFSLAGRSMRLVLIAVVYWPRTHFSLGYSTLMSEVWRIMSRAASRWDHRLSWQIEPASIRSQILNRVIFAVLGEARIGENDYKTFPDTSPNIGSVDQSDFKTSGGSEPLVYFSKFETKDNKYFDDPILQNQEVLVAMYIDGKLFRAPIHEGFSSTRPVYVRPRFVYLANLSFPENQRYSRATSYARWKYDIRSLPFFPVFEDLEAGQGVTEANLGGEVTVKIDPSAFASGRKLISVIIHENGHYSDYLQFGSDFILLAGFGRDRYREWEASGKVETLTEQEKANIIAWASSEVSADLDVEDHPIWQYLSTGEKGGYINHRNEHQAIVDEISAL
ncbi:hypothetical protein [Cerasicoccus maritimus]|uniref:hypothetical protein n=1 Tax=Cerasicoccus maritimus TaxID=490089 RepID=UPI0028524C0D|nr:hypothetical protein [Cerasicoccus maritimus]